MKHFVKVRTRVLGVFVLLPILALASCESMNSGTANAPFSRGGTPQKLYVVNDAVMSEDQRVTLSSLQGILAKTGGETGLYRNSNEPTRKWLSMLETDYGIELDRSLQNSFVGLLQRFAGEIDGYILYNSYDLEIEFQIETSLPVALTLAGPLNAVVLSADYTIVAEKAGIPLIYDAREKRLEDVIAEYGDSLNRRQVIYRSLQYARSYLTDYGVMGDMIQFFYPEYSPEALDILEHIEANGALLGWGSSEEGLVGMSSERSLMVHPADWANNLSVFANVPAETYQKEVPQPDLPENESHTVCFLMSDGDNIQWAINGFATDERWYGSDYRGKVNMGWTISPALTELAPAILKYFYDEAATLDSGRDCFVAGPSGLGYIYPNVYPDIEGHTELLNEYMARADLSIVNIIGRGGNSDYLESYLSKGHIDAVFLYDFFNYAGGGGEITWVSGKPVITARANLWKGFHDAESLASILNSLPADNSTSRGYSLIAVHAWTQSLEDVYNCASMLDENVRVVPPDEFVRLIIQNVKRP